MNSGKILFISCFLLPGKNVIIGLFEASPILLIIPYSKVIFGICSIRGCPT